jgi:type IV secretory pathway TrbF-like protein
MRSKSTILISIVLLAGSLLWAGNLQKVHPLYRNLTGRYSFKDVVRTLQGIRANKINGQWRLSQFTKNTRKLCTDLNIKMNTPLTG